jgi:hypothetical protein
MTFLLQYAWARIKAPHLCRDESEQVEVVEFMLPGARLGVARHVSGRWDWFLVVPGLDVMKGGQL